MGWEEELRHGLAARGLAVDAIPGKGRALVALTSFTPGQVILSQEPYASTPSKIFSGTSCDRCFTSNNLRRCSACHIAWYCGNACQIEEWKLHKYECQVIVALPEDRRKSLTSSIRLMVRLVLRKVLQSKGVIATSEFDNYSLVNALKSHMSEVDEKQLVLYAQMANLVNLILPSYEINLKEITQNFAKLTCNCHSICDPELRPLGTGLYPVISIINHSCDPNAVLVFEGRVAYVRALKPIAQNDEVLISYIETAATTSMRKNDLKQYFFTCKCTSCSKELLEDAALEGYRCIDQECDGILLIDSMKKAFTCQTCGISREELSVKNLASEIASIQEEADSFLSQGKKSEAVAVYKEVEQLQRKVFHLSSLSLLRTLEAIMKVSMELADWKTALVYCKRTIPIYQRVYPPIHPMTGLQFYTCGKLEWLLERTDSAILSLTKAADILVITHGTTSPLVRELLDKLAEAQAEASYKRSAKDHQEMEH